MPVEDGESEEGSVAVGSEGGLGQGRQVVHVVETRAVCVIVARQQQVHMIWSLDTEERERGCYSGIQFSVTQCDVAGLHESRYKTAPGRMFKIRKAATG